MSEIIDKIKEGIDKGADLIEKGANAVVAGGEKVVASARSSINLAKLDAERTGQVTKLGETYYSMYEDGRFEDKALGAICLKIKDIDEKVKAEQEKAKK